MHILLANRWFPPDGGWGGGVRIWNYTMARAFRELGHQVTVLASRTDSAQFTLSETEGFPVYRLPIGDSYRLRHLPVTRNHVRTIKQLNYSRRVKNAIRALNGEKPIDVVEFADVGAEGFFYARAPETAAVVRCHTPTFVLERYYDRVEMPGDNRLINWCEKDTIRRAHARTAPSNDLANIIALECHLPRTAISAIPNALWVDGFAGDTKPGPHDSIVVLHVGRLERIKGVVTLVEAIPGILSRVPNARFVFIGDDRPTGRGNGQRAELEEQLRQAGVRDQVEFVGKVDQTTLMNWYQRADICVVPSMLYESFSYTCAQGMAAGKPVVASRIGGIPETLDDGESGLLVTPGNSEELAQAVVRLALDPALRGQMGLAGMEKVKRDFDPRRVAERILSVYKDARVRFSAKAPSTASARSFTPS